MSKSSALIFVFLFSVILKLEKPVSCAHILFVSGISALVFDHLM